jgi:hypothetical protein
MGASEVRYQLHMGASEVRYQLHMGASEVRYQLHMGASEVSYELHMGGTCYSSFWHKYFEFPISAAADIITFLHISTHI